MLFVDHVPEPVRMAEQCPEGGVELVALDAGDPLALFQALAQEATRTGFVPLLAATDAPDGLPRELRHRHIVIVCEGRAGRAVAARWVRTLAHTSPRRHIVVTLGAAVAEQAVRPPERAAAGEVAARIARAERWQRRGRAPSSERWLSAAAGAARRRGDLASAATVDLRIITALLDTDRSGEAERRARRVKGSPSGPRGRGRRAADNALSAAAHPPRRPGS